MSFTVWPFESDADVSHFRDFIRLRRDTASKLGDKRHISEGRDLQLLCFENRKSVDHFIYDSAS